MNSDSRSFTPVTPHSLNRKDLAGAVLIFILTLSAYSFSVSGKPLWDDDAHLTSPALQSLHGLSRIWFEVGATQQYYPILHSAFWIEHHLWGDAVWGYHLANILFHGLSACLVVLIMRRLGLAGSWMAGLIFALHPVCVESVAWISEQKNTLSAVFFLASGLTYLRFDEARRKSDYMLAFSFFVLALLSKSVTATLPASLLVVLWWQRGRLNWKRDIAPLLPWLGLGVSSGLFTAWVERTYVGARGSEYSLTFIERSLLAGRVVWFYASKLVWPSNLMFNYPRWTIDAFVWWQYLPLAGLLALTTIFLLLARRRRGPLAALLFFVGTLFPVLGFLNVFPFIYSYVADHFQYLAMLGVIVPAASALVRGTKWLGRKAKPLEIAACGLPLLLLGSLAWEQTAMYADAETLWQSTVSKNSRSWMAYNNFAKLKLDQRSIDDALLYSKVAVMLKPDSAATNNNLGQALHASLRLDEAIESFRKASAIRPDVSSFHGDLANALEEAGRLKEAIPEYELALAINPADIRLSNNLAWTLATSPDPALRDGPRAVKLAERAVNLAAGNDVAMTEITTLTLSTAYAEVGRFDEAVETAEKARMLALNLQHTQEANWIAGLLEIYRTRRPYHASQ